MTINNPESAKSLTTVEIRARRLAYCPRLLKHAPQGLLALLQSPYRKRLVHRSWSQTILDDIYSLIRASGSRLADLGDPQLTPHACARCMRDHPKMIKKLADGFLRPHAKSSPVTTPTSIPTRTFSCDTCGKQFSTLQAVSTLEWTVHRRQQVGASYIDESGRYPVCNRTYHTRLRAIKHVASVAACRDGLASGDFEKITEAHRTKLDNADRAEARAARTSGISVFRSHGLRA